ncbi:MAG TPA: four helix bundle protein [Chthoniobacterales bacterium]|nr:four helix bundle protein [Chthoniobacterales bacterium]
MPTSAVFDHEKLNVYQKTLEFVAWVSLLLEHVPKSAAAYNQLDRASTSIALNIAEGTGKFTAPDRCRYYDSARGSALECAACLDVLVAKSILPSDEIGAGKELLRPIVSMLVGLIKSVAPDRVFEESTQYGGKSVSES